MNIKLLEVLKTLRKLQKEQDAYLASVPRDLQPFLFDNEFVNKSDSMLCALTEALFGSYSEDVNWFLYEFNTVKESSVHVVDNDVEYTFKTDEDFYEYIKSK